MPTRSPHLRPAGIKHLRATAILLATGCRERPAAARLIPGDRPLGVFTTGSLQRFVYEHGQAVGKRAVVVGGELVSLSALLTLRHAGATVARLIARVAAASNSAALLTCALVCQPALAATGHATGNDQPYPQGAMWKG